MQQIDDDDDLSKHYQTELEVIRVQRKKGIEVFQQLKERKKPNPPGISNTRSATAVHLSLPSFISACRCCFKYNNTD
ncbi:MAG: hypothetical protein Q7U66_02210 [Methylobacter sp.]|nr:hypothetical protein [Methylobacter sp.]